MQKEIFAIGFRLAYGRNQLNRLRQVILPTSAFLSVILLLLVAALYQTRNNQEKREQGRVPVLATSPTSSDLLYLPRTDTWQGKQYLNIWVAPSSELAPVLPPGLTELPKAGEAFVSPGLARLLESEPQLQRKYPQWRVIQNQGVKTSDELLAYLRLEDSNVAAYRVSRFGFPVQGEPRLAIEEESLPSSTEVIVGGVFLLLVPAIVLLAIAISIGAEKRSHRVSILQWLGAPRGAICMLLVGEGLALAAPATLLGALAWSVLSSRVSHVPIATGDPLQGDLVLPVPVVMIAAVLVLVAICLVACIPELLGSERRVVGTRPRPTKPTLSPLRASPLVLSLVLFTIRPWSAPHVAEALLIGASVSLLIGLPLSLPAIVRTAGVYLSSMHGALGLLAGAKLAWSPSINSRPFGAIAVLVTLSFAAVGAISAVNHELDPQEVAGFSVVSVLPPTLSNSALQEFKEETIGVGITAVPLKESRTTWTLVGNCEELQAELVALKCVQGPNGKTLSEGDKEVLYRSLGIPREVDIELATSIADPSALDEHGAEDSSLQEHSHFVILAFSTQPIIDLEQTVSAAAIHTLPGSSTSRLSHSSLSYPPSWGWVQIGLLLGGSILASAIFGGILDRFLTTRPERVFLMYLGLSERGLRKLEQLLFMIPLIISLIVAEVVGTVMCWMLLTQISPGTPMPWVLLGLFVALSIIATLFATTLSTIASSKSTLLKND